jgi:hypothetical protein
VCTDKVGQSFVGETELRQRIPTGAFAICAIRLVKLTLIRPVIFLRSEGCHEPKKAYGVPSQQRV